MIAFVIAGILLTFAALEAFSLRLPARAVRVRVETDLPLCAPGEEIALRYTVTNNSFLPLLYVGLSVYLDDSAAVHEPEEWQRDHVVRDISGLRVEHRLRLMPHSRFSGRVRFSIGERGLHTLGRVYVETGDYLGLRAPVQSLEANERVVCTAALSGEELALRPLGGLLGEQSVRRFLHEDPCLIAGYREYTGRESMRQISWTQTAKTGQWMVKQQDHTAEADVAVLLNMDGGDSAAMERCLSIARTVCEELEEKKIPYTFRSNGDLRPAGKGLGRGHLFPILRGIGLSRLACYTGFGELVDRCIGERRSDRTYVVITSTAQTNQLRCLQASSDYRLVVLRERAGEAS